MIFCLLKKEAFLIIIMNMANFDHFNLLAPLYDRFIKPTDPDMMQTHARLPVSGNLLDVGGGTGRSSHHLKDLVSTIYLADSSLGMLNQAVKKNAFVPVCSLSEELPFGDNCFDRVIMVDALHHVKDYRLTASELWRVVKPGGRIVIEDPDIHTVAVKIMAIVEKIALMRSHLISAEKICEEFTYPNARTSIEREGNTSWVIIDKLS